MGEYDGKVPLLARMLCVMYFFVNALTVVAPYRSYVKFISC
jgi:hypothetical protein